MALFTTFLFLCCLTSAFSGVVTNFTQCGGLPTDPELLVETCEGPTCVLQPGTPYEIGVRFTPVQTTPSLSLRVSVEYLGKPISIIDRVISNTTLPGDQLFDTTFKFVPSDFLGTSLLPITIEILRTDLQVVVLCIHVTFHLQ